MQSVLHGKKINVFVNKKLTMILTKKSLPIWNHIAIGSLLSGSMRASSEQDLREAFFSAKLLNLFGNLES